MRSCDRQLTETSFLILVKLVGVSTCEPGQEVYKVDIAIQNLLRAATSEEQVCIQKTPRGVMVH